MASMYFLIASLISSGMAARSGSEAADFSDGFSESEELSASFWSACDGCWAYDGSKSVM